MAEVFKSVHWAAWCALSGSTYYSISSFCCVNTLMIAAGFCLQRCKSDRSLSMNRCILISLGGPGPLFGGNRNLCLAVLDRLQTLSENMFFLPPWLNEPLSASTQYLFSEDLHCASERSIAGQCLREAFCFPLRLLMVFNGETRTTFPWGRSQISARDT